MGGLFSSKSSSTVDTRNYADSFNRSVNNVFSPTSTGGNITVNVGASPTGNAIVDGLTKMLPIIAIALIGWAFLKR